MSSVIIVDDQRLVRDGLRLILELAGHDVVAEAADGSEGVSAVLALAPDVVLMDVRMPVLDGIEATRRIVAAESPSRVIMLTTFDVDEHVVDALRVGASGYLLKDAGGERIVAAVQRAAEGEMPVAGPVMARLVASYVSAGTTRHDVTDLADVLSARAGGALPRRPGPVELGDRRAARHFRGDGQEPRPPPPRQAGPT